MKRMMFVFIVVTFCCSATCNRNMSAEDYYYIGKTVGEPLNKYISEKYPEDYNKIYDVFSDFKDCYSAGSCAIDIFFDEMLVEYALVLSVAIGQMKGWLDKTEGFEQKELMFGFVEGFLGEVKEIE